MRRLALLEFMVLRTYKPFWIFILGYALILVSVVTLGSGIEANVTLNDASLGGYFGGPSFFHTTGWLANWLCLLHGFIIVMVVANDLSQRTLRTAVVNGLNRLDYVMQKSLLILALFLFSCVLLWILFAFVVPIDQWPTIDPTKTLRFFTALLTQHALITTFALLTTLLVQKPVPAAAIVLTVPLILEPMLAWVLSQLVNFDFFAIAPFAAARRLIPLPFQLPNTPPPTVLAPGDLLVVVAGIVLLTVSSSIYLRKCDL